MSELVMKTKRYPNITLCEKAIHNPKEPRHFMTVCPTEKKYVAKIDGVTICNAKKVWILNEVANVIVHPVVYFHIQDIVEVILLLMRIILF